jgi:hypothetical protein
MPITPLAANDGWEVAGQTGVPARDEMSASDRIYVAILFVARNLVKAAGAI